MNAYEVGRLRPGQGVWFEKESEFETYGEFQSVLDGVARFWWESGEVTELAVDDCEGLSKHDGPPMRRVVVDPDERSYMPARAFARPAAGSHFH